MTWLLDFIHARKWLVELIVLALIGGAIWWGCQHLIDVGVQRQKDADSKQYADWKAKADEETGRLKGRAEAAETAHVQASTDLATYIANHTLHGSLCQRPSASPTVPSAATANQGNAGATASLTRVQPVPDGDSGGEPDQLHMLQVAFARCDALSAQVREWQSR